MDKIPLDGFLEDVDWCVKYIGLPGLILCALIPLGMALLVLLKIL